MTSRTYRPAYTSSGTDVPLERALAFSDLYTQTVQEVVRAASPPPPEEPAAGTSSSEGEARRKPRTQKTDGVLPASTPVRERVGSLDIQRAMMRPEVAARFAAIILVHDDGTDVTEAEARGADFPAGPFIEAWGFFMRRADELTRAHLGSPEDWASNGAAAGRTPTTTPASSSPTSQSG